MSSSHVLPCAAMVAALMFVPSASAQEPSTPTRSTAIHYGGQIAGKPGRPLGPAETGDWVAYVEASAFREIVGADGTVRRALHRPILGQQVDVVLPEAGRATLVVTGITEVVEGISTVSGVLAHDTGATFTFSFDGGKVFGSIRDRTYNWDVEPNGDSHRLRRIERRLIPAMVDKPIRSPHTGGEKSAPYAKTGGTGRVDILFLYANNVSNAASLASNIVSNLNSALTDSLVSSNNFVVSAGVQMINDDFDNLTGAQIIFDMAARDTPFEDVMPDRMFDANADIALLIVEEDAGAPDHPTYGRVGGVAIPFDATAPYALTTDDYALGDFTALHEIGHVFNGEHEDHASGTNRGKSVPASNWQTLMGGYADPGCVFAGLSSTCERIRYFSNPAVSYSGTATGDSGSRDMESELESSMVTASTWRNSGDSNAPGIPSSITKTPEFCWGLNSINWSSSSGANTYRLYESSSSSFTSPTVVYTGSNLSTTVSVPNGSTRYYRIRACDGFGCSNFTSQVSASYFNGCL